MFSPNSADLAHAVSTVQHGSGKPIFVSTNLADLADSTLHLSPNLAQILHML